MGSLGLTFVYVGVYTFKYGIRPIDLFAAYHTSTACPNRSCCAAVIGARCKIINSVRFENSYNTTL